MHDSLHVEGLEEANPETERRSVDGCGWSRTGKGQEQEMTAIYILSFFLECKNVLKLGGDDAVITL